MRILVIDDNKTNRDAAVAQLGNEHEVVTAAGSDEALNLLGYGYAHGSDQSSVHKFDAVLCDLLMPSPGRACYAQDMDAGIYLAITAARNGAKYVGLLTDGSHHSHPAADCLDSVQRNGYWPDVFSIDGALVCVSNNPNWIKTFSPDNLGRPLEHKECGDLREDQVVRAKNWRELLDRLLKEAAARPADSESISAVIADRNRLKVEANAAEAESKKLQAQVAELEAEARESAKSLLSFHAGVLALKDATDLGWWQRRRVLPKRIKDLIGLIMPKAN